MGDEGVAEHIQTLAVFAKIQRQIIDAWGAVELRTLFGFLLGDTGGNNRQGFAPEHSAAILALSFANQSHLEPVGQAHDDASVASIAWAAVRWKLPRNF